MCEHEHPAQPLSRMLDFASRSLSLRIQPCVASQLIAKDLEKEAAASAVLSEAQRKLAEGQAEAKRQAAALQVAASRAAALEARDRSPPSLNAIDHSAVKVLQEQLRCRSCWGRGTQTR